MVVVHVDRVGVKCFRKCAGGRVWRLFGNKFQSFILCRRIHVYTLACLSVGVKCAQCVPGLTVTEVRAL